MINTEELEMERRRDEDFVEDNSNGLGRAITIAIQ